MYESKIEQLTVDIKNLIEEKNNLNHLAENKLVLEIDHWRNKINEMEKSLM